jgi:iron-sulfur cluster assembly accessory protein
LFRGKIKINKIEKVNEILKKKETGSFLRLMVEGGGCSGYQYIFKVDTKLNEDEDVIFTQNNTSVILDKISLPFLEGATIDYKESMMKSSFFVSENPKAEISCSCGTSFSPKL